MPKFDITVCYEVQELITVEAENIDEAEDKALEMLADGVTDHNIVGDSSDDADIYESVPSNE